MFARAARSHTRRGPVCGSLRSGRPDSECRRYERAAIARRLCAFAETYARSRCFAARVGSWAMSAARPFGRGARPSHRLTRTLTTRVRPIPARQSDVIGCLILNHQPGSVLQKANAPRSRRALAQRASWLCSTPRPISRERRPLGPPRDAPH